MPEKKLGRKDDYYTRHSSWESGLTEHQQRTFEEIKKLNQKAAEMAKGGDRPPEKASPRQQLRQKRHQIVSEEDI